MKLSELIIHPNGDIRCGDIEGQHSVAAFYLACMTWLDQCENLPVASFVICHTPHYVELLDGFNIDNELASYLNNGTIQQLDSEYYSSSLDGELQEEQF